jgi:hypothetical protein
VPVNEIKLEWTPLDGVSAYRLNFRDAETGELLVSSEPLSEPRYAFDPSVGDGREIEARLQVRREGADEDEEAWEHWGPDVPVAVSDSSEQATVLTWEAVSPVHRLVIADQTNGTKVLDRPVLGASYTYVPGPERGHDLVMRVRGWRDGEWDEGTEWRPLPLRVMLGERREPPPPLATDTDAGLLLAFTIDTEGFLARQQDPNPATTVDELIYGDFGNSENHGIGLHMDLLEHFGYRGCFFVDVLSVYQYGEDQLKRAVETILERGHEVQLHVHDEHLRNSDDRAIRALAGDLMAKDHDAFREILSLGVEVFERLTGNRPIAYRAGGYRITDEHFSVLGELGIKIDTSVNAYFHSKVSEWMRTHTQPYWVDDVLELPVTWTLVRDNRSAPETRAFAPNATAGDPVSRMPSSANGIPRVVTYVSHSSELMVSERGASAEVLEGWERSIRGRVRDEIAENAIKEVRANARLVTGRVNEDLLYRVAGLLRRISDRDDARCVTFADLNQIADRFPRDRRREPVDPVPTIDRPHGAATVTGTRIYSEALLSHLRSSGGAKPRRRASDDEAVTVLANADVAWKDGEVAVIGKDSSEIDGWLERRDVARVELFEQPPSDPAPEFDVVAWPSGFERSRPTEIGAHLEAAAGMLRDGGTLVIRVRTLGADPGAGENGEPPLSELLFPVAAQRSAKVTAWDAPTFSSWLQGRGFRVVAERRIDRSSIELKALDRFADKLGAFPEEELVTAAVDFTLRRAGNEEPAEQESAVTAGSNEVAGDEDAASASAGLLKRFEVISAGDDVLEISPSGSDGSTPIDKQDVELTHVDPEVLADGTVEPASADVVICSGTFERMEPERVAEACSCLYKALRPGGQLLLSLGPGGTGSATRTTILVGLLRAGFELVATEGSEERPDFRLLRPLELADILSFAS